MYCCWYGVAIPSLRAVDALSVPLHATKQLRDWFDEFLQSHCSENLSKIKKVGKGKKEGEEDEVEGSKER